MKIAVTYENEQVFQHFKLKSSLHDLIRPPMAKKSPHFFLPDKKKRKHSPRYSVKDHACVLQSVQPVTQLPAGTLPTQSTARRFWLQADSPLPATAG